MLSFKRFCSTGAVHHFSHLHSRGDKELAGEFIFARGYTVVLSLYQPEIRQASKVPRFYMYSYVQEPEDRRKAGEYS